MTALRAGTVGSTLLPTGPLVALAFFGLLVSPGAASSQDAHPHPMQAAHAPSHQAAPQGDAGFAADMGLVHAMLVGHEAIVRTVTNLPNGVTTLTESNDPQIAAYIKAHVASMDQRLVTGEVFNMGSSTIPTIFENAERVRTEIDETATGVKFTQTTEDPALVATLQAHAEEVSELARDGMAAMMRNMMKQEVDHEHR